MKISIHIEEATEADVKRLFGGDFTPARAHAQAVMAPVSEEVAPVQEEEAEETAPVQEETAPVQAADDVLAKLDARLKRTKTVTIKDGVAAKPEDMVSNADGELGIIVACFRGIAVVEYEDGRMEQHTATDLTLHDEGQGEEEDVLGEEPEPAAQITAGDLMAAAKAVLAAKGGAETQKIVMAASGGARKVSEVPPAKFAEVHRALTRAIEQ